MKIKTLMDFLSKEAGESRSEQRGGTDSADDADFGQEENVVYIENSRLEDAREQSERRDLLARGTQWADRIMGEILVDLGRLREEDIDGIVDRQREKGLYFGEAALELKLVSEQDILHALSIQFGYSYDQDEKSLSTEMVMAYSPFDEQAEKFRSIRAQLLNNWLQPEQKTLAIVSPESKEGRSYVAANLALAFSQSGHSTLLIDADMRAPRQHNIFNFTRRIGLSMLLAGRIKLEDLDALPDQISNFQYLSVLGCGAVPPNPAELLSNNTFFLILRELKKFYDVIIIDTPPAGSYHSDIISIASVAGSALLVARRGSSKMDETQDLLSTLSNADARVVGAVLNQY